MAFFLLLLFLLIVMIFFKLGQIKKNQDHIALLEIIVNDLREQLLTLQKKADHTDIRPEEAAADETPEETMPVVTPPPMPVPEEEPSPPHIPEYKTTYASGPQALFERQLTSDESKTTSPEKPRLSEKLKADLLEWWQKIKENVDWEQFTGARLFAWIGGIALFIGAGFFVKYSIDTNLIPPAARLAIGAIVGLGLIIGANGFQRGQYDTTRHTLTAGGIGVLYSVVFAATLYYKYLPKIPGFTLLSLISAAAFVLAVYHRGIAISVLGALGAYATPIMVSTGQGNLFMLFLYLAVVNIGLYQVIKRLTSPGLLLLATVGTLITLSLGSFFAPFHVPRETITGSWIANLILFSAFLGLMKDNPEKVRSLLWAGIILYLTSTGVSIFLLTYKGIYPLLVITTAIACAVALALREKGWYDKVVPFSAITFCVALLWALLRFDAKGSAWHFLLLFAYGLTGGIGPILLIMRYGPVPSFIQWFKIFPTAVVGLSLIALFKKPDVAFWFWPMTMGLQVVGIFISLVFGAIRQVGLLVLLLVIGGLAWIIRVPSDVINYGFYGFILVAGIILSIVIFFVIRKLPRLVDRLHLDTQLKDPFEAFPGISHWMTASPCVGAFLLIAASFIIQKPLDPHPGMATMACFLALSLFLCLRLAFQPLGIVTLLAAAFAQATWVLNPQLDPGLYIAALTWSSILFCCALVIPFIVFRSFEKWHDIWMGWALFEVSQGFFIIWAGDHLWPRTYAGWLPLVLAGLKLPVVYTLLQRLKEDKKRNAILAFHGGVLLFYFSAIPILLLDYGWIGLTLVFEASALLWLNKRIIHPGLRWVACVMSPAGLILLITHLTKMKPPGSLPILNSATLSVAASIVGLAVAVKLSDFPQRLLRKMDLPHYYLWLTLGTGFFLINLMISDLFAGPGVSFKFHASGNLLQSICSSLLWTGFGAVLWRVSTLPRAIRFAGLILLSAGATRLILFPFIFPAQIANMRPVFNLSLLAFLPLMVMMMFLFLKEPRQEDPMNTKNLFMTVFLIAGFLCLKIMKSTLLQPGHVLHLLSSHTGPMAVGSAAGWLIYGLGILLWPKGLDRPFRVAGIVLILLGLVKAVILPFRFRIYFGALPPILNTPSLLYMICLASLAWLTLKMPKELWPVTRFQPRPFWGILLAITGFIVLNIEIAGAFGVQHRPFSLLTHGSLAHQLGYSLGWLIFSIGLLVVGIKWKAVQVRWAALALLAVTALKIFLKDLWALDLLYRVASFVGLSVVLILVSILYQRYLSGGDKHAKENAS